MGIMSFHTQCANNKKLRGTATLLKKKLKCKLILHSEKLSKTTEFNLVRTNRKF